MICSASKLLPLALLVLAGCGDGTYPISGSLSVDGQPVPKGRVTIAPDGSGGSRGNPISAAVRDGRFDTGDSRVQGGGSYRLNIKSYDGVPYKLGTGMVNTGKELAPPQDVSVELPEGKSQLSIDIRKGGPNLFEVDVQVN